ncbi:MAG: sulfatase [Verrucomicrobiae bacterium]|nr:sulfatase [Verrucomicrobiae bacterium]
MSAETPRARPNLVFLLADQLRASATGYGGDPNVRTPNLDRLAAASVNFRNAVSVCPVCTPYRAALMTGRFPTTTGMFLNDLYLPDEERCFAEILRDAGYTTGYIGKWHLDGHGRESFIPPERRQGFEYWKAAECDHNYHHSHYYEGDSPEKRFWDGYDAFAQTRDAQQYIREHARNGRPFALFVSYGIPHFPHETAPDRFKALYPPERIRFLPNVPPALQTDALRREAQGYYAHISALDECVGDILRTLAETGIEQDTILVFTSDHGEMLASHGVPVTTKQVPWDESARVPFLLRYPRAHATGRVTTTPLTTPDILPTILRLAGLKIPKTVEGRDLSAVVRRGRELRDRAALYMNVAPFARPDLNRAYRALRTARYTYVRALDGPWLLFDDARDPFQLNNLLGQPHAQPLVHQLDQHLRAELKRIGDDFQPAAFYVEKFGYELAPHGSISYAPGAKVQSPKRAR